ncbi:MAG: glycosyltransferase, partial [Cytophagaceae bacterium]
SSPGKSTLVPADHLGTIGFVWDQFGAYHIDRLTALGSHLTVRGDVIGLEIATTSDTYDWAPSANGTHFRKVTLFPGENANHIRGWRKFVALFKAMRRERISTLFISGYETPAKLALAVVARLTGRRVIVMNDSKFDDRPRRAARELIKRFWMLPYQGAFASGRRAREYLYFQGFAKKHIAEGYDTVSLARLRAEAQNVPEPEWEDRPFLIVARLVHKKNLLFALNVYKHYCSEAGSSARRLVLCGSGPLLNELLALAAKLGINDKVCFLGSQSQARVATEMAGALCLLVPSSEEQWGLVVNEAMAFSLPLLVSDAVGARDSLVCNLRNGFVLG